jgi:periplasmic divalent cation tolerance protein
MVFLTREPWDRESSAGRSIHNASLNLSSKSRGYFLVVTPLSSIRPRFVRPSAKQREPLDSVSEKQSPSHMQTGFFVVLVTAPTLTVARRLARKALEARLVACANLLPRLESHYWWKDQIESSRELLLLFKTTRAHLASLEKLIAREHPYETPEFVALSITHGSRPYLAWIQSTLGPDLKS